MAVRGSVASGGGREPGITEMRLLRWICGLTALGVGIGVTNSFFGFSEWAKLRAERDRLAHERQVLQQVVERLSREQRVADVIVVQQERDAQGTVETTQIEFIELDRDGHPLAPREFCLPGRVLYFDGLVIKFAEEHVAAGDPLRGKSIMLFRRLFSEVLAPKDGPLIDGDGGIPDIFRVQSRPSDFEQKLWDQFWSYATNPELAKAEGIRVAQGEAVYAPMTEGQRWSLTLDLDGGLNLRPLNAPNAAPAAESGSI